MKVLTGTIANMPIDLRNANLIISISNIAIYIDNLKQFIIIAKLIKIMKEANILIRLAIYFFNKCKKTVFFLVTIF